MNNRNNKSIQALDDTLESLFVSKLTKKNELQIEEIRNELSKLDLSLNNNIGKPITRSVNNFREFLEDEVKIKESFEIIEKINKKTNRLLEEVENNKKELAEIIESNIKNNYSITQIIAEGFSNNDSKLSAKLDRLQDSISDNKPLENAIDSLAAIISSENSELSNQLAVMASSLSAQSDVINSQVISSIELNKKIKEFIIYSLDAINNRYLHDIEKIDRNQNNSFIEISKIIHDNHNSNISNIDECTKFITEKQIKTDSLIEAFMGQVSQQDHSNKENYTNIKEELKSVHSTNKLLLTLVIIMLVALIIIIYLLFA
ncbi:hypothetical protein ACT3R9_06150 [Psychrobacter sp. AOP42-A1-21]|uniref:hypothetical protein n=2 Tax=Psychrobacter TaxID=497 RepID=UPI003FDA1C25